MNLNRELSERIEDLERDGLIIIKNVIPKKECDHIITRMDTEAYYSHSELMWQIRTDPRILSIFQTIWNTHDIITGYDGIGVKRANSPNGLQWHVDQDPFNIQGRACLQGILAITESNITQFALGSHLYHQKLTKTCTEPQDWQFINIDENMIHTFQKIQPKLNKGDIIVWDSRLTHRVVARENKNKRIVAYLSFSPLSYADKPTLELRKKLYNIGASTTHWPHRVTQRVENKLHPPRKQYDECPDIVKRLIDGKI